MYNHIVIRSCQFYRACLISEVVPHKYWVIRVQFPVNKDPTNGFVHLIIREVYSYLGKSSTITSFLVIFITTWQLERSGRLFLLSFAYTGQIARFQSAGMTCNKFTRKWMKGIILRWPWTLLQSDSTLFLPFCAKSASQLFN